MTSPTYTADLKSAEIISLAGSSPAIGTPLYVGENGVSLVKMGLESKGTERHEKAPNKRK